VSLILDALRKADAERQQGQVPGLHTQSLAALPIEPPRGRRTSRWRWWAVAAIVCVAASASWLFLARESPEPVAATGAVQVPPPSPPATSPAAPAAVASAATSGPRIAAAPADTAGTATGPAARAHRTTEPVDVAEPAPWPARESRKAQPTPAPPASTSRVASQQTASAITAGSAPAAAGSTPAPVAPAGNVAANAPAATPSASARATAPALLEREQLPQDMRAALPPLVVSGAIYSTRAQHRTLIVDGRLYRENDTIAPNLSLERIEQKSAIFLYRGYRFQVLF